MHHQAAEPRSTPNPTSIERTEEQPVPSPSSAEGDAATAKPRRNPLSTRLNTASPHGVAIVFGTAGTLPRSRGSGPRSRPMGLIGLPSCYTPGGMGGRLNWIVGMFGIAIGGLLLFHPLRHDVEQQVRPGQGPV